MSYWRFLLSSRPGRQRQFVDGDVRVGDARIVDENIDALNSRLIVPKSLSTDRGSRPSQG